MEEHTDLEETIKKTKMSAPQTEAAPPRPTTGGQKAVFYRRIVYRCGRTRVSSSFRHVHKTRSKEVARRTRCLLPFLCVPMRYSVPPCIRAIVQEAVVRFFAVRNCQTSHKKKRK